MHEFLSPGRHRPYHFNLQVFFAFYIFTAITLLTVCISYVGVAAHDARVKMRKKGQVCQPHRARMCAFIDSGLSLRTCTELTTSCTHMHTPLAHSCAYAYSQLIARVLRGNDH